MKRKSFTQVMAMLFAQGRLEVLRNRAEGDWERKTEGDERAAQRGAAEDEVRRRTQVNCDAVARIAKNMK